MPTRSRRRPVYYAEQSFGAAGPDPRALRVLAVAAAVVALLLYVIW